MGAARVSACGSPQGRPVDLLLIVSVVTVIGKEGVDDLGADSLDQVELVMAFEEEFGSDIPDEDAEKLTTVGDAIKYIESKQNA